MGNTFRRVTAFILGVVFGFTALFGGLVGGAYYAYKTVKPLEYVIEEGSLGEDEELSHQTVEQLIDLITNAVTSPDSYTIARLQDEYNIDLKKLLTDAGVDTDGVADEDMSALQSVSIWSLFTDPQKALDNIKLRVLYVFVPALLGVDLDDILSKEAQAKLGDYTISELITVDEATQELGIVTALKGLNIGALLPSIYDANYIESKHEYEYVLKDDTAFTNVAPLEILGNVAIKSIVDIAKGEDAMQEFMEGDLQNISHLAIKDIAYIFSKIAGVDVANNVLSYATAFGDTRLCDLFVKGQDGSYTFSYDKLTANLQIGYLLGLNKNDEGKWLDSDGVAVKGLIEKVASYDLSKLIANLDDGLKAIEQTAGDITLKTLYETFVEPDEDGNYPAFVEKLAEVTIKDIIGDGADKIGENLMENFRYSLGLLNIGDMLSSFMDEDTLNSIKEKSVFGGLLSIQFKDILMEEYSLDNILTVFDNAIGSYNVGEMIGYEKDGDGNWNTDSELLKLMLDYKLSNVIQAVLNRDTITDICKSAFGGYTFGDFYGAILGYSYDENLGLWKNEEGETLSYNFSELLNKELYKVVATFDDSEEYKDYNVLDEIEALTIGDVAYSILQTIGIDDIIVASGNDYVFKGDLSNLSQVVLSISVNDARKNITNGEWWISKVSTIKLGDVLAIAINNIGDFANAEYVDDGSGNYSWKISGKLNKVIEAVFNIEIGDLLEGEYLQLVKDVFGEFELYDIGGEFIPQEIASNDFISATLDITVNDIFDMVEAEGLRKVCGILAEIYQKTEERDVTLADIYNLFGFEEIDIASIQKLMTFDLGEIFTSLANGNYQYVIDVLKEAFELLPTTVKYVAVGVGVGALTALYFVDNPLLIKVVDEVFGEDAIWYDVLGEELNYTYAHDEYTNGVMFNSLMNKLLGEDISTTLTTGYDYVGEFGEYLTIGNLLTITSEEAEYIEKLLDVVFAIDDGKIIFTGDLENITGNLFNISLANVLDSETFEGFAVNYLDGILLGDILAPILNRTTLLSSYGSYDVDLGEWVIAGERQVVLEDLFNISGLDIHGAITTGDFLPILHKFDNVTVKELVGDLLESVADNTFIKETESISVANVYDMVVSTTLQSLMYQIADVYKESTYGDILSLFGVTEPTNDALKMVYNTLIGDLFKAIGDDKVVEYLRETFKDTSVEDLIGEFITDVLDNPFIYATVQITVEDVIAIIENPETNNVLLTIANIYRANGDDILHDVNVQDIVDLFAEGMIENNALEKVLLITIPSVFDSIINDNWQEFMETWFYDISVQDIIDENIPAGTLDNNFMKAVYSIDVENVMNIFDNDDFMLGLWTEASKVFSGVTIKDAATSGGPLEEEPDEALAELLAMDIGELASGYATGEKTYLGYNLATALSKTDRMTKLIFGILVADIMVMTYTSDQEGFAEEMKSLFGEDATWFDVFGEILNYTYDESKQQYTNGKLYNALMDRVLGEKIQDTLAYESLYNEYKEYLTLSNALTLVNIEVRLEERILNKFGFKLVETPTGVAIDGDLYRLTSTIFDAPLYKLLENRNIKAFIREVFSDTVVGDAGAFVLNKLNNKISKVQTTSTFNGSEYEVKGRIIPEVVENIFNYNVIDLLDDLLGRNFGTIIYKVIGESTIGDYANVITTRWQQYSTFTKVSTIKIKNIVDTLRKQMSVEDLLSFITVGDLSQEIVNKVVDKFGARFNVEHKVQLVGDKFEVTGMFKRPAEKLYNTPITHYMNIVLRREGIDRSYFDLPVGDYLCDVIKIASGFINIIDVDFALDDDTWVATGDYANIFNKLINKTVTELKDGVKNQGLEYFTTDEMYGTLMIGELIEKGTCTYDSVNDCWLDKDGNELVFDNTPEKVVFTKAYRITIGDVMGGLSTEMFLGGILAGDVLGYKGGENNWYKKDVTVYNQDTGTVETLDVRLVGINMALANIALINLVNGNFSLSAIFGDSYLGDLLNLIKVSTKDENGNEKILGWYDFEEVSGTRAVENRKGDGIYDYVLGNKVNKLTSALSNIKISSIFNHGMDAVMPALKSLYVGDLLEYSQDEVDSTIWYENKSVINAENGQVENLNVVLSGIYYAMARIKLGDVLDGSFNFDTIFDGIELGDLMGLTKVGTGDDVTWHKSLTAEVGGTTYNVVNKDGDYYYQAPQATKESKLTSVVASISVSSLLNGGINELMEALRKLYVGDLVGYELIDGNWYGESEVYVEGEGVKKLNVKLIGIDEAMSKISIDTLLGENFSMSEAFGEALLGDLMGFAKKGESGNYTWYEYAREGVVVGGHTVYYKVVEQDGDNYKYVVSTKECNKLTSALSGVSISDLFNHGMDDVIIALDGLYVGDLLEYTNVNDVWYKTENVHIDGTELGTTSEVSVQLVGVDKAVAGLSLKKLLEGKFSATDLFNGIYLGELMGYGKVDDKWYTYKKDGDNNVVKKIGTTDNYEYVINEEDATGKFESALANISVGDLFTNGGFEAIKGSFDGLYVGDLMDYTKVGDTWYSEQTVSVDGINKIDAQVSVDTLNSVVANLNLANILDGQVDLQSMISEKTLGNLMGLIKDDDVWYMPKTVSIGGTTYTQVKSTATEGYYDVLEGEKASKLYSDMAEISAGDLLTSDGFENIINVLRDMRIGDLVGYTYNELEGKWYKGSDEVTGAMQKMSNNSVNSLQGGLTDIIAEWTLEDVLGDDVENNNILKALRNSEIQYLDEDIVELKVGKVMGYTYNELEDKWYNDSVEVTGINKAIADYQLGNITGAEGYELEDSNHNQITFIEDLVNNKLYVQDVFPNAGEGAESELEQLLDPTWKVSEITTKLSEKLKEAKVELLIEMGIFGKAFSYKSPDTIQTVQGGNFTKMDKLFMYQCHGTSLEEAREYWLACPINSFLTTIFAAIP